MQVELRHSPSYAVARLHLAPAERIQVEAGGMVMQAFGVTIESKMQGGFMSSLKRSALGGESFFVTTFIGHPQSPTWVDVAPQLPGDATVLECRPERGVVLTRGSWLASEPGVNLDTKWGSASLLVGGEGGFVIRCTGQGQIVATSFGALDVLELPPGAGFTIDTGHLVAYDDGMQVQVRKIAKGWIQSGKSGEGFVMDIQGPGRVWTQSRNPSALVDWLTMVLPFTRT
jgi:uncharacterized protein (TIGR00266 family)